MATFCQCGLPSENCVSGLKNSTKLQQIGTSKASTKTPLILLVKKNDSIKKSKFALFLYQKIYINKRPAIMQ